MKPHLLLQGVISLCLTRGIHVESVFTARLNFVELKNLLNFSGRYMFLSKRRPQEVVRFKISAKKAGK